MSPTPDQYYNTSQRLTNVAAERVANEYIAGMIFPVVPSALQKGKVWLKNRAEQLRKRDTARAPGAPPNQITRVAPTTVDYNAIDHSLFDFVSDEERSQADPAVASEVDSTEGLMDALNVVREDDVVTKISGLSLTDSPGSPWDTSGDIVADMKEKFELVAAGMGGYPNAIAIGENVLMLASESDSWKARVTQTMTIEDQRRMGLAGQLEAMLGLAPGAIIVAKAWVNEAGAEETPAFARIWDDNVLMFRKSAPSLRYDGLGVTVRYTGAPGSANGVLVQTEYVPLNAATRIIAHDYYDNVLVNPLAGFLWTSVLS